VRAWSVALLIASCATSPTGDELADAGEVEGRPPDAAADDGNVQAADAAIETAAPPTCTDQIQNQGETDVDCGGICPKCGLGKGCSLPGDCASGNCTNKRCCTPTSRVVTTGAVSGTGQVCCAAGETLAPPVVDCGNGSNHSATQQGNCGVAHEGNGNGGSACAQIRCNGLSCSAPDAGDGG
jgi:hypothetical protein